MLRRTQRTDSVVYVAAVSYEAPGNYAVWTQSFLKIATISFANATTTPLAAKPVSQLPATHPKAPAPKVANVMTTETVHTRKAKTLWSKIPGFH